MAWNCVKYCLTLHRTTWNLPFRLNEPVPEPSHLTKVSGKGMGAAPLPTKQVGQVQSQEAMNDSTQPLNRTSVSPLLIVMLVALAIFPFVVRFLPPEFRHYLDLLYR